jgi:tRNA threonylcarbamoyladenosine biosynthesis protein TsaE
MELAYSLSDIGSVAKQLLTICGDKRIFAFEAEMGAGKTTLIAEMVKCLGVDQMPSSPTFSIINEYSTVAGDAVFHMDWYRLKDAEEAIHAGVEDCLFSGNYCFVEWPERASSLLPSSTLMIQIIVTGMESRKLTFNV